MNHKILSLDPSISEKGYMNSRYCWKIGGSVYEAFMVKYAGVDPETGAAMYYIRNSDGSLGTTTSYDDCTNKDENGDYVGLFDCGSMLPKLYGGFGTTLRWKGFDFTAGFSFQLGGKIYDSQYQALMCTETSAKGTNIHMDRLNAWTPENAYTNIPRWTTDAWGGLGQNNCDFFLTSSDYLSINNITLGYTFPTSMMRKTHFINSLRVYVSGDNLALISARKGLDPRFSTGVVGGYASGTGLASGSYSAMRTITGGVTVTF